jgi:hypothetical protein
MRPEEQAGIRISDPTRLSGQFVDLLVLPLLESPGYGDLVIPSTSTSASAPIQQILAEFY